MSFLGQIVQNYISEDRPLEIEVRKPHPTARCVQETPFRRHSFASHVCGHHDSARVHQTEQLGVH